MSNRVSMILARKGDVVHCIAPHVTLAAAAKHLTEHGVGALVVSADGAAVDGILSERDIVREVARIGHPALQRLVGEVCTAEVALCDPRTTVDELMVLMTSQRIRHVPVVEGGALVGIVSIGDVVKARLDDLEVRSEAIEDYLRTMG